MRADLKRLKRDTESGRVASVTPTAPSMRLRKKMYWIAAAVAMVSVAVFGGWLLHRRAGPSTVSAAQTAVAVLPFQNLTGDAGLDYLPIALSDQVATVLTYAPSLAVRPFSSTRRYSTADTDPLAAGKDLKATHVVTGSMMRDGPNLRVTMEAVDVANNRVTWRDSITVPSQELLRLQDQLSSRLRGGLVPALGARALGGSVRSTDPRAYELFMRAAASSYDDAAGNEKGIELLQRASQLDPNFASVWAVLSERFYYKAQYFGGGEREYELAREAAERAVQLDAESSAAEVSLIVLRVEGGELDGAYDAARQLVARQPDSANSHAPLDLLHPIPGDALNTAPAIGHERECPGLMALLVSAMAARIAAAGETPGEGSGQQIGWDGETVEQMKFALTKTCGLGAARFSFHIVAIMLQDKEEMQAFFERENRTQFLYRLSSEGKAHQSGLIHAR